MRDREVDMARGGAAEWVILRRRAPRRALRRFAVYVVLGLLIAAATWVLFQSEPDVLDSGRNNPAASISGFVLVMVFVGIAIAALPVLRPPQVALNHYGMLARPGVFRTLLLPWVHIEEIAAVTVPDRKTSDAYLLIACDDYMGRHSGDLPWFLDRAVLREANRTTEGRAAGFDLAVRLADFKHEPRRILSDITRYAPEHINIVDQLDD